jgi:hypothetical protein
MPDPSWSDLSRTEAESGVMCATAATISLVAHLIHEGVEDAR